MAKESRTNRRGARDAGREKLLDAARALFRSKVRYEVSRQDIARHAGLTPALLTYYFATKADLVLAVTRPVMTEAIAKLVAVLESPLPLEERLKQSVVLFIDFARENSPILDLFVEAVLEGGSKSDQVLIDSCLEKLGRFFTEAVQAGLIAEDTHPRLLLLSMWGMCRLVGETPPIPIRIAALEAGLEGQKDADAEFITGLILRGTKPPTRLGAEPTSTVRSAASD